MNRALKIRSYDYVNHPYERVRAALTKRPLAVFQAATKSATARAHSLASELSIDLGGIKLGADIEISVTGAEDRPASGKLGPSTLICFEWQAAKMHHLFPFMEAELSIYPLTASETQLDFSGVYKPPLGALGRAVNAVAGHRIAESSVHRFISDVAAHLRTTVK